MELNLFEKEANALMLSMLQERQAVRLPAIGCFEPLFHSEYILDKGERRLLIPPHISLSFNPSEYLLKRSHYTTLDYTPPSEFFEETFITNLARLHGYDEEEAGQKLAQHVEMVLKDLFRGRRTTLLDLGDLFVTEEGDDNLFLNFVASENTTKVLNLVFSAYEPVVLNSSVHFPELDKRMEMHENRPIQCLIPKQDIEPSPTIEPIVKGPIDGKEISIATPKVTEKSKQTNKRVWNTILGGSLLLIIVFLGYLSFPYLRKDRASTTTENVSSFTTEEPPTIEEPVEAPQPTTALDTIRIETGITMAKLARLYYNNSYYWIYIYFENHENIQDPNNIDIGQELIIPTLEKYNLLEDPQRAEKEAKEWATLIFFGKFNSYEDQRKELPIYRENNIR